MEDCASEADLVANAVAGDRLALEHLLLAQYDGLAEHLRCRLSASLQGEVSVEDLIQETFIQVFRDIAKFQGRGEGSFSSWVRTIAENRLLDAVKRLERKKRGGGRQRVSQPAGQHGSSLVDLVDLLSGQEKTPSRLAAKNEAIQAIQVGLAGLPEDQRQAIWLRYLDGRDLDETAEAMQRTPDAVRGLVHRGKQALRRILGRSSIWLSKKQ